MGFEQFDFSKNWENPEDFPTYEPNETKVRADLQLLHNETKAWINRLVSALNAPGAAAMLPFAPAEGMTAQTVQAAIEEVFASVTAAANGSIANGAVTKEKLAPALLKRIYGGRVWVSLGLPDESCNPETDFPIGQLWLRPAVTLEDSAQAQWRAEFAQIQEEDDGRVVTADGTQDYFTCTYTMEHAGEVGQKLAVLMQIAEENVEAGLFINGTEYSITEEGVYEAQADTDGSLQIAVTAECPYGNETARLQIRNFAVVNLGAIEQALGCELNGDQTAALRDLGTFETKDLPMELLMQTSKGVWQSVWHDVLPVSRGGTGLKQVEAGALLYGTGGESLGKVTAEEGGILQWQQGAPQLVAPVAFTKQNGFPYIRTGTYVGNGGETDRTDGDVTVQLALEQGDADALQFLVITPTDGSCDTAVVAKGGIHSGTYSFYDGVIVEYRAWVELQGRTLTFRNEERGNFKTQMKSHHLNEQGVTYRWIAVCGGFAPAEEGGEQAA